MTDIDRRPRGPDLRRLRAAARHVRRRWNRGFGRGSHTAASAAVARATLPDDDVLRALDARTGQQAAVAELGQLALSGADVPMLEREAARLVAQGLAAEFGTVIESVDGRLIVRAATGWGRGVEGAEVPATSQAGYTLVCEDTVLVEDTDTEDRFPLSAIQARHGVRSSVSAAIPGRGGAFGVLAAHHTQPRTFTPDDLHFLRSMANTLGAAVRHRRAEEQLREAEGRYRTLVERIPAVTYTAGFGRLGDWHYVSPQMERLLGYRADEWVADPELWFRRLHPDDRDRVLEEEEADRRSPPAGPVTTEYRMLSRDGRVVWIRDEAVVVRDTDGRPVHYQGVMYDVSERKHAEQALRAAYERERQAAERLRSLDEMKNAFLTAVSHELRTPLASILGFALTLEQQHESLSADQRKDMVDRLAANARKLDRFLSDLLDVDRLARGIIEPRRVRVDVASLVREVAAETDLGRRPVTVDAERAVVEIDGPKVERIVENLLINVARHTPDGTPVTVRVRDTGDGAVIAVDDRGPGVPDELKGRIFEPFERGPQVSPHTPGSGIGLSLVGRFAELHGGRAWVEDVPGGGASFRVLLPRLAAADAAVS
ncbi:MAG TPA: ATP-binding protein [Actinomycetota bacterium]|nr:ATP-binding protein [Actinomycetota bacterium]